MIAEQWVGTMLALAVILAAANVLAGRGGFIARLSLRLRPRRHAADDRRQASTAYAKQRRSDRRSPRRLRTLSSAERAQYVARWRHLQRRATALPATTLLDADDLLSQLLEHIGYPTEGFVQYAADLSGAHAAVVDDYRVARSIVLDTRLGLADTAQIRHALLRYAPVFEGLAEADLSARADGAAA